jgi:hypothetical protein
MGRRLIEKDYLTSEFSMDITSLEKGSYIIQIRLADNSVQTKHFQKL